MWKVYEIIKKAIQDSEDNKGKIPRPDGKHYNNWNTISDFLSIDLQ